MKTENSENILRNKTAVFEKAEKSEIEDERKNEENPSLFCSLIIFLKMKNNGVIENNAQKHQYDVSRLSPGVKNKAYGKKNEIFITDYVVIQAFFQKIRNKIQDAGYGQKHSKEGYAAEYHREPP